MSVPSVDAAPVAAGRCARLRFAGAAWSTAAPSLAASRRRHAIRGIAITRPGTARNLAARHRWWCAAAARDHMWRCEVRPVSDGKPYSAAAATERIPAQPLLLCASCLPALPDSLYAHKTSACMPPSLPGRHRFGGRMALANAPAQMTHHSVGRSSKRSVASHILGTRGRSMEAVAAARFTSGTLPICGAAERVRSASAQCGWPGHPADRDAAH